MINPIVLFTRRSSSQSRIFYFSVGADLLALGQDLHDLAHSFGFALAENQRGALANELGMREEFWKRSF